MQLFYLLYNTMSTYNKYKITEMSFNNIFMCDHIKDSLKVHYFFIIIIPIKMDPKLRASNIILKR